MLEGSTGDNEPILHTLTGNLLTFYGLAQLVLGKIRPGAPKDGVYPPRRQLWEAVHKNSGRVAMLVALVQLFTGASLAPDFAGFGQASWYIVVVVALVGVTVRGVMLSRTGAETEVAQPKAAGDPTKQEP